MSIRIVSDNLNDITPDCLPQITKGSKTRMLFLCPVFLGFRTYMELLMQYAEKRDDVDAVFVKLHAPTWMRVIGKSIPGLKYNGWDFHSTRHMYMWKMLLRRWLTGPLDLSRFDVVHVLTEGVAYALPGLRNEYQIKWALNIDSTAALEVAEFDFSKRASVFKHRAYKSMLSSCDLVVCRNRWASCSVKDDYKIEDEKILVAANSMNCPVKSNEEFKLPGNPDHLRIIMVGNDFDRKGGFELLNAHQEHFADRADLYLCTRQKPDITNMKNVYCLGEVSHDQLLQQVLPAMDVFCLWTHFDMHPWAILEALSVGVPVLSTRLAGIPDMVIHDETGLLCQPRDWTAFTQSLDRLLSDEELRKRLGKKAIAHVKAQYNPDKSFNGLFDRLVKLDS